MPLPRSLVPVLLLGLALTPSAARAAVRLPAILSDRMVLQAGQPVAIWGWAGPEEVVTVSFLGQSQSTRAGTGGRWAVTLAPLPAGEGGTLIVRGENRIEIQDVLVGEVWLGSGQSNMAMTVARSRDYPEEQAAARLPRIRLFKEESPSAETPQTEPRGRWVACAPDSVGAFSATLYFFGRELHRELGVPVGLINSSVGGTPIEAWIAAEAQRAVPELRAALEKPIEPAPVAKAGKAARAADAAQAEKAKAKAAAAARRKADIGGLFNGKIAPLVPYTFRGALWYQGEANTLPGKPALYEAQLRLLVQDWRQRWGREFPFAWVQLPNFGGAGRDWPAVREAMLRTLALPGTGMAITIDVGEEKDIHPRNKQDVGRRLSLWALGTVYGRPVPATSGPLPAGHEFRGREVALRFRHTEGGLVARGGPLTGFQLAGEDRQWRPATARIEGDRVIVSSPDVPRPAAARYAWENFPACNLYNGAGLPASPFRTNDWR
ncbi:MAG: sialate O-acetylesterase [Verrucomicrobia bacterium]|nr:sialate O-acetylesterase [Verrucomicrobiota bacterium]